MNLVSDLRHQFSRIDEETRKAARYLTVSRAVFRIPNFARRWTESDVQEAMEAIRQGTHMSFATTLAATYQSGKGIVTIPNLILKLQNQQVQFAIAKDSGEKRQEVARQVLRIVKTFERIKRLPVHASLKRLRDKVIAHHSADTALSGSTMGPLNRLMVRTVVLVDQIGLLLDGKKTGTREVVVGLLEEAKGFWSHGIAADPFALRGDGDNSTAAK